MEWFDNLLGSFMKDKFPTTLPEPTRPAPPMPTCKTPKPEISEPVITLLKELEKDVWEVKTTINETNWSRIFKLTHIYKEEIVLSIYDTSRGTEYQTLWYQDWMTMDEKKAVIKAAVIVVNGQLELAAELSKIKSREDFSKILLG